MTNEPTITPKKYLLIAFLMLTGLGARFVNMEAQDWHYDEMFHVFAANSVVENGHRELPGGKPYVRSPLVTYLGAASIKAFGFSHFAGRLPSVLFGTFLIFLMWRFAWKYGSESSAWIAAFLTAFSPLLIALSRFFRYYAEIQVFTMFILFILIPLTQKSIPVRDVPKFFVDAFKSRPSSFLLKLVVLAASLYFLKLDNKLTLVILPALYAVMAVRLLTSIHKNGWAKAAGETDFFIVAAGLLGLAGAMVFFRPQMFEIYWESLRYDPWATANMLDHFYYFKVLFLDYPLFPVFFSAGAFVLIREKGWTGGFLLGSWLIPLLIMSFFFRFRVERYMGYLMPLFYLFMSLGLVLAAEGILKVLFRAKPAGPKIRHAVILGLFALYAVLSPWSATTAQIVKAEHIPYDGLETVEMRSAMEWLEPRIKEGDPIVTHASLLVIHYLDRNIDYVIVDSFGEDTSQSRRHYSGAVKITSAAEMKETVNSHNSGWVIFEGHHWKRGHIISSTMKKFIEEKLTLVDHPDADTVVIYRWDETHQEKDKT